MPIFFLFLFLVTSARLKADSLPDPMEGARAQLQAGRLDAAIQILQNAAVKDPVSVPPSVFLTELLIRAERFDEADAAVKAALAKNPNASDLHRVAGDLLFRHGQILEADNEYKTAFHLDQNNARAVYGVAHAFQVSALRHKADLLIRRAHDLNPNDPIINRAFDALDGYSTSSIARWQRQLDLLKEEDADLARSLEIRIAVARALNGKHEFELTTPYTHYQAPLIPLMNGRQFYGLGLSVAADGIKTELQLDTGAGGILLSSRFAEKAGVRHLADGDIRGIGNEAARKGWIGFVERIQIGSLEFRNCIVHVSDRGSAVDSGGLIGTDIFRRFMVKFDFRAMRFLLDTLPGPAWDGFMPVDRYAGPELNGYTQLLIIHHYLLIPAWMSEDMRNDEPTPGLFLIDTGSSGNSVSTNAAQNVTKMRDSHSVRIRGLNGKVRNVYEADKIELRFDTFLQRNLGLTAFDLTNISRSAGAEVSGIMGMPLLGLFASFTIDYRDGRLKFDYKR